MIHVDAETWKYDPAEVPGLIELIVNGAADVVFGSRPSGARPQRVDLFGTPSEIAPSLLTCFLFNTTISDMETGYKAFRSEVIMSLDLREDHSRGSSPRSTGEDLQAQAADLRAADPHARAQLRGRQEHHVVRHLLGGLGAVPGEVRGLTAGRRVMGVSRIPVKETVAVIVTLAPSAWRAGPGRPPTAATRRRRAAGRR